MNSLFKRNVLFIDLTNREIREDSVENLYRGVQLGGVCIGWRMIYDLLDIGTDAFSPKNPIIISVGSLVGTSVPGAAKIAGTSKFPTLAEQHKNFIGSSISGGRDFNLMLKSLGYEHLIITGKSDRPVYISILDGEVEINEAEDLWGKDTEITSILLKRRHGNEIGCLSIGEAGENLVRYAIAIVDMTNSLGRNGLGAVFGSKKLKAIVVKGNKNVPLVDQERFDKYIHNVEKKISEWDNLQTWRKLGMGGGWSTFRITQYPGKWTREKWDKLYGTETRLQTMDKIIGCSACRIACRTKWKIRDGEYAGEVGLGSPYGKSATSGQLLDIEDHRKTIHLVTLANKAGLDFYTFTRMTDWLTVLFQEGVITKEDTLGQDLSRNYDNYLKLLDQVVKREGFGSLMADGWLAVSEKLNISPNDYWYAGICKGVDFIYDARAAKFHPLMMAFFTNPRPHHGGCHSMTMRVGRKIEEIIGEMKIWGVPEKNIDRIFTRTSHSGQFNVGRYTKWMEDAMAVRNSLGVCSMYSAFGMENMEWLAELFSAVTGNEISAYELMIEGEKAFTYKKLANVREGFTRKDDRVPELWLRPMNSPEGKEETTDYYREKVLTKDDFKKTLDDYYDERGWDIRTGIPTIEKLEKLGIKK